MIFHAQVFRFRFGRRRRTVLITHQMIFIIVYINGASSPLQRIYLATGNFGMKHRIIFFQNTTICFVLVFVQIEQFPCFVKMPVIGSKNQQTLSHAVFQFLDILFQPFYVEQIALGTLPYGGGNHFFNGFHMLRFAPQAIR